MRTTAGLLRERLRAVLAPCLALGVTEGASPYNLSLTLPDRLRSWSASAKYFKAAPTLVFTPSFL